MQQSAIYTMTLIATAAVAEKRFVTMDGAQVGVAGAKAVGVADYAAAIGDAFSANVVGTSIVEAGAAIPLLAGMTPVKSDAAGKAIAHGGAGEILGYARQAAAAAGNDIEILLAL